MTAFENLVTTGWENASRKRRYPMVMTTLESLVPTAILVGWLATVFLFAFAME
jgi:hypothetical protein